MENLLIFAGLDAVIAFLFYRSFIAFLLFLPIVSPFLKVRRKDLGDRRRKEILAQFTTGMQMVNASLQAGYAIENSFREAIRELARIYPDDSFIIYEPASMFRSKPFFWILAIALISKIFEILQRYSRRRNAPVVI